MKILMVSISSIHFFRWTEQLKDAGHEIFWFDIVDGGKKIERISWVHQIVAWKLRWDFPGRTFIKSKFPRVYNWLQKINERNTAKEFEKTLQNVQPDVVHSFAMQISCLPILDVMNKYNSIKWIYSSWGSDIFNEKGKINFKRNLKNVLSRIDFLFTDNLRDYNIAVKNGFKGEFLGAFPGGGGYSFNEIDSYMIPFKERNLILIKGYEDSLGKCINVLRSLIALKDSLKDYDLIIFGANDLVVDYVKTSKLITWKNIAIYKNISHSEVFSLMGKAKLYIGNSLSDGIPNTLLEAICLGVFPIQTDPGGVTREVLIDGLNGAIISEQNSITAVVLNVLTNIDLKKGIEFNLLNIKPNLEYELIKTKVKDMYKKAQNL